MSKKSGIIIFVIILILISIIISIYIPNMKKINEQEDTNIVYSVFKKNEKYGVIDKEQKIIIEPQYKEIIIVNPHRDVFICKNEDGKVILNKEKQKIFKKYNDVRPIKIEHLQTEIIYEKNILVYEKDGKYGLVSIMEENVTDPKYEQIYNLGYKQGEVVIKQNDKYGIIDEKGNTIIKNSYDSIESDGYYTEIDGYKKSGYIVSNKTNDGYRYGYYDYLGEQVLNVEYNQIIRITQVENKEDIYLIASKNGQYGAFINNNKIINTQYQSITYESAIGMFIVEVTEKYGAINEKGKEILKTEYSQIEVKGIGMYTQKDEERKIFNKEGNELDIPFETIIDYIGSDEYYIKRENESYSIVDSELKETSQEKYKYLEYIFDNYFIAINAEDKNGIIDAQNNIKIEFQYDLIQKVKDKNVIQAIDFTDNKTTIYNSNLEKMETK